MHTFVSFCLVSNMSTEFRNSLLKQEFFVVKYKKILDLRLGLVWKKEKKEKMGK